MGCVPESVSVLAKWWAVNQQAVEQAQDRLALSRPESSQC